MEKVASVDKELFRVPGGHIGIMAGSEAAKRDMAAHRCLARRPLETGRISDK